MPQADSPTTPGTQGNLCWTHHAIWDNAGYTTQLWLMVQPRSLEWLQALSAEASMNLPLRMAQALAAGQTRLGTSL